MKKLLLVLSVFLGIVAFTACNSKGKKDNDANKAPAIPEGMVQIDLSKYGLPVTMNIPDTTTQQLSIENNISSGATLIKVGKGFQISISVADESISLKENDIKTDDVDKFIKYVVQDSTTLLYETKMVKPAFHFYTIVKTPHASYYVKDIRMNNFFTQKNAEMMLKAAKSIHEKPKVTNPKKAA